MKRVNILFAVTVCLLVAPVFTLPANIEEQEKETPKVPEEPETPDNEIKKHPDENEINSEFEPESEKAPETPIETPIEIPVETPDQKPVPEDPEIGSDENTNTENNEESFYHSSGIIYNFYGDETKEFPCKSDGSQKGVMCPAGSVSCTYSLNSTDNHNAKTKYECLNAEGEVVLSDEKDEVLNFTGFSDIFDRFRQLFQNMFNFPLRLSW